MSTIAFILARKNSMRIKNKHNLTKAPIIVSGIGQDILFEYFKIYFINSFKKTE